MEKPVRNHISTIVSEQLAKAVGLQFKKGHLRVEPNQRHQADFQSLLHPKVEQQFQKFI